MVQQFGANAAGLNLLADRDPVQIPGAVRHGGRRVIGEPDRVAVLHERDRPMAVVHAGGVIIVEHLLKRDEFVRTLKAMYEGGKEFIEQQTWFCFYGFGRDPNEFVAVESWKDENVVAALRKTPEFQQGFAALMSCVSAPMEMELFRGWDDPNSKLFELYPRGVSQVHAKTGEFPTVFL